MKKPVKKLLLWLSLLILVLLYFSPVTIPYPARVKDAPAFGWGGAVCERFYKVAQGGIWLPHRIGYAAYRITEPHLALPADQETAARWQWHRLDANHTVGGRFDTLRSIFHVPSGPEVQGFEIMGPEMDDIAGCGLWDPSAGRLYVDFYHIY
jgi:hypothetical protein